MTIKPFLLRTIVYPVEAALALLLWGLLRLLPLDAAGWLGAHALSLAGPLLSAHRLARRNLERAFPEKAPDEIAAILAGMWRNLGRTAGEWGRLPEIVDPAAGRIELVGREIFERIRAEGGPGIFISGHLANWEVLSAEAGRLGVPVNLVYRAPNNPLVRWIYDQRRPHPDAKLIPKGPAGAKQAMAVLRRKGFLGILIDQKLNEGIPVPFFGRDAPTAQAFAQFALRYRCPVTPIRIERLAGARFRITVTEPLALPDSGDREADIATLTRAATARLEQWIRERPEQWLWVHKRWRD